MYYLSIFSRRSTISLTLHKLGWKERDFAGLGWGDRLTSGLHMTPDVRVLYYSLVGDAALLSRCIARVTFPSVSVSRKGTMTSNHHFRHDLG